MYAVGATVELVELFGRGEIYVPGRVESIVEDLVQLLTDEGELVVCSSSDLRPPPPAELVTASILQSGDAVDLWFGGAWEAAVSTHAWEYNAEAPAEFRFLHQATLDILPFKPPAGTDLSTLLRKGVAFTRTATWQPRTVPPLCNQIITNCQARCRGPQDLPKHIDIKKRKDGTWSARARSMAGRSKRVQINGDSVLQVVAARLADLLAGKDNNFPGEMWQEIKAHIINLPDAKEPLLFNSEDDARNACYHVPAKRTQAEPMQEAQGKEILLQLADEAEPRMVPGNAAAAAGSNPGTPPISPLQAGTPDAGAKRGRDTQAAQGAGTSSKRSTPQRQQQPQASPSQLQDGSAGQGSDCQWDNRAQHFYDFLQKLGRGGPGEAAHGGPACHRPSVGAAAAALLGQGPDSGAGGFPGEGAGGLLAGTGDADFGYQFEPHRTDQQQQEDQQAGFFDPVGGAGRAAYSGPLPPVPKFSASLDLPLYAPLALKASRQGAAAAGQGPSWTAAGGLAVPGGDPCAPASYAQDSLGRLSLSGPHSQQQQQQRRQGRAGNQQGMVGAGGQQVAGGLGGAFRAGAPGGSNHAVGEPALVTSGVCEVWEPGQVLRLTLMSLDTAPATLGTYLLRVVKKLGEGGEGSVWSVELLGPASNSDAPGPSRPRVQPPPPAAAEGGAGDVGTASPAMHMAAAAAGAAADAGPSTPLPPAKPVPICQPMRRLMALKVPRPFHLLPPIRRWWQIESKYNAKMRAGLHKECTALARCSGCDAIVDTLGWGTVQLTDPTPQQQQRYAAAAAEAGSRTAGPLAALEMPVMLLEYAEQGTAWHQVMLCPPGTGLSCAVTQQYVQRAAQGLHHLHVAESMCHRDLKAINCLLFNPPGLPDQQPAAAGVLPKDQLHFLKLADMGIAKGVGPQPGAPSSDTLVATPSHRAPELQPGRHHTYNIDVWYLACLMLELLSARPPFAYLYDLEGLSEAEREARRSAAELDRSDCPYRDLLNEEEMAFARTCLETDPGVRPYLSYLMDENHLQRSTYLLGPRVIAAEGGAGVPAADGAAGAAAEGAAGGAGEEAGMEVDGAGGWNFGEDTAPYDHYANFVGHGDAGGGSGGHEYPEQ